MTRALVFSVGLVVMSGAAEAAPITVSAGESVIFNFDFAAAGLVPAPPYWLVDVKTGVDPSTLDQPGDVGTWGFFDELNAGGDLMIEHFIALGSFGGSSLGYPGLTDGAFSVVLTMTAGDITADPSAIGYPTVNSYEGGTPRLFPTTVTAPVPEPVTLTLLAGGLMAAALRRRARRGSEHEEP